MLWLSMHWRKCRFDDIIERELPLRSGKGQSLSRRLTIQTILRRLPAAVARLLIVISVLGGTLLHAMEPIGNRGLVETAIVSHFDGDGDQVPADLDTGYPHHHAQCPDHHMDTPARALFAAAGLSCHRTIFASGIEDNASTAALAPGFRPPIA